MQPDPDRDDVVLCADLIAPEGYGEIIGGSERIHDAELMKQRIEEHELDNRCLQMVFGIKTIWFCSTFWFWTWT